MMHDYDYDNYRRDTLEDVMANIHFADNALADEDTFYKVNFNLT